MNFFLLLKNELSLALLRNLENAIVTTKSAIHLYATKEEQNKQEIEKVELQMLEKILKSQMQTAKPEESKEEKKQERTVEEKEAAAKLKQKQDAAIYEKIISKLLEYNEKVNEGREISVVEFLKRIEPSSDFMKQYETQRHMRRAFMEEFKIHSYNYILLLLESVMRILTTSIKDHFDDDEDAKNPKKKKDKINFMSKNYKRFLENRQKKIDKFIVNCIGWNHVNRCIEVLDMTIRDLVHKIVPTKVVIRELKTSSGKGNF
jgi:hypothetical protein